MSFIGVYKALYAYTPQSSEELTIDEGDILYLLEKSDVDDWWTVKKRVVGPDAEEPVGLVPSNYIEPADFIGSATALYDYDRQTEEELSFKENEQFHVYDDKDPDWILVNKNNQEFGFVPSNYIEMNLGGSTQESIQAPTTSQQPTINPATIAPPPSHPSQYQPPPQRQDRVETPSRQPEQQQQPQSSYSQPPSAPVLPTNNYTQHSRDRSYDSYDDDHYEDDAPPPKPTRPSRSSSATQPQASSSSAPQGDDDDQLFTWSVSEVDGRKKKKAMLAIGNSTIYFSPDSVHGGSPHQWAAKDLLSFSSEKKHLFMEFRNPLYSLEIHTGTKDVAAEILSVLGELRGSESTKALKEVQAAAASKPSSKSLPVAKKTGKILYDFEAQGDDELTVLEGDTVIILNDKKSKDWWMVQHSKNGQTGVVPAQFVQPTSSGESSLTTLTNKFKRSKSKENLSSDSPSKKEQKKLQGPKPSRIRTWEDVSGTFKVDAEFLGVVEGKIHLHKTNGVKIAVAAPKLSITDLEYVEKVTGMSLEQYKHTKKSGSGATANDPERERRERKERERRRREKEERERDRAERERDRRERELEREERERLRKELKEAKTGEAPPPPQPARPGSTSTSRAASAPKDEYDWFEFFLESGVDVNQCQRYTTNFNKEQIDPSILESIDASVLRTLGLREGDIIRVMRYLDQKFNRQPKAAETSSQGGLFTEPTGALKANRTGSASGGVSNSLPAPTATSNNVDDDAWTVKPAANTEASDRPDSSLTQNFTGSMQDLVNLKPLAPTATASSTRSVPTYAPTPSKPLEPTKSGAPTTATSNVTAQKTGDNLITSQQTGATMAPLDPFKTGGANILPLATGGAFVYIPTQQTGAIGLQPTGLVPLQKTGGLTPGLTGVPTGGLMPLQKTGGLTPGLTGVPTGGLMPLQKTGVGLPFQTTGAGLPLQKTGPFGGGGLPQFGTNSMGSLPPTTSFGQTSTFNQQAPPMTSFGSQPTGGFQPQSQFGLQQTGLAGMQTGQPTGGFGTPFNNFQPTGSLQPQQTSFNQPQQPMFSQQPTGFNSQPTGFGGAPTTSFGSQQPTGFNGQATGFNSISSPPTFNTQQQTPFGQPQFNQQMNQMTNAFQNTSLQSQSPFPQQSMYQNPQQAQSFGGYQPPMQQQQQPFYQNTQPQLFGGFQPQPQPLQPLESQPTGFGFGNSNAPTTSFGQQQQPLGSQMTGATGQRANLANATAENPFGF